MRFGVRPSSHTREASCSDQPWKARLMSERHKKWDTPVNPRDSGLIPEAAELGTLQSDMNSWIGGPLWSSALQRV